MAPFHYYQFRKTLSLLPNLPFILLLSILFCFLQRTYYNWQLFIICLFSPLQYKCHRARHWVFFTIKSLTMPCLAYNVCVLVARLYLTLCDPMDCSPARLPCPWNSPDKNNEVGCHFLLHGIFQTHGSNPGLLHFRQILYQLSLQGGSGIQ